MSGTRLSTTGKQFHSAASLFALEEIADAILCIKKCRRMMLPRARLLLLILPFTPDQQIQKQLVHFPTRVLMDILVGELTARDRTKVA